MFSVFVLIRAYGRVRGGVRSGVLGGVLVRGGNKWLQFLGLKESEAR